MYQIFVAEDELLIRQSIRGVIEKMQGPYVFCGEAADGELALTMMQDLMPDILLTDIRMPFLDGFGLIRNVKSIIPWIKIIIISGYGEFEYARKAISLGVDQYLLKPIRSAELMEAIKNVSSQIDSEKADTKLEAGYGKDEIRYMLKNHFMKEMLYGSLDTAELLEKARQLELDIVSPLYKPVLFAFEGDDMDHRLLRNVLSHVVGQLDLPLYSIIDREKTAVLLKGTEEEALTELAWQTAGAIRHETREICPTVTVVIGETVKRISEINTAYKSAVDLLRKVSAAAAGTVIDINDAVQLTENIIRSADVFGDSFRRRISEAGPQEVPAILDEFMSDPAVSVRLEGKQQRYYALISLVKIALSILSQSMPGTDARDIASELCSRYDIIAASRKTETFRSVAENLLVNALEARPGKALSLQHCHVVSRAQEYIRQNFADPNITLNDVASHVGMSPAHFSTVFSQSAGCTFISWLTSLRIEKAKELLMKKDKKLSDIALEIGYNEPNYFSHVFRKTVGMTPKEFRSENIGTAPAEE